MRELVENSLDAAESISALPDIEITMCVCLEREKGRLRTRVCGARRCVTYEAGMRS